jgi:Flp pilus assembly protein TadG
VFPLLVAIVFGVIDGGRLIASRVMLSYAVNHGARIAALSSTTSQTPVDAAIRGAAPLIGGAITIAPVSCTTGPPLHSPCTDLASKVSGNRVSVTATYAYAPTFITSFSRTLTQTSWVVVE